MLMVLGSPVAQQSGASSVQGTQFGPQGKKLQPPNPGWQPFMHWPPQQFTAGPSSAQSWHWDPQRRGSRSRSAEQW